MKDLFVVITINFLILSLCRGIQNNNANGPTLKLNIIHGNENSEISTKMLELGDFPSDCSQRQKQKTPYKNKYSRLKKCCPIGESLSMSEENHNGAMCASGYIQLELNLVNVTLYDNCIEDMENEFILPLEIGNPCNTSIIFNNTDDLFFILQDGSLLVMDLYGNDTFALYDNYCVDVNNISGITYAIVCITSVEIYISRTQMVVVGILMLMSIPCLLLVAYVHLCVKEFRCLHGMILSCMTFCLAIGYLLYSLVHLLKLDDGITGYAVQFFLLSYYFWFFCLCCNNFINIWKLIMNNKKTRLPSGLYFGIFCIISFIGAAVLVTLTFQKGLPGMASYFIQGYTESIRESQRYFIPPVTTILILSILVMTAAFFGFQKLKVQGIIANLNEDINNNALDEHIFGEIKNDLSSMKTCQQFNSLYVAMPNETSEKELANKFRRIVSIICFEFINKNVDKIINLTRVCNSANIKISVKMRPIDLNCN